MPRSRFDRRVGSGGAGLVERRAAVLLQPPVHLVGRGLVHALAPRVEVLRGPHLAAPDPPVVLALAHRRQAEMQVARAGVTGTPDQPDGLAGADLVAGR